MVTKQWCRVGFFFSSAYTRGLSCLLVGVSLVFARAVFPRSVLSSFSVLWQGCLGLWGGFNYYMY